RFALAGMIAEMLSDTQGRVIPIEQLAKIWSFTKQSPTLTLEPPNAASAADASAVSRRLSSLLHTFDREAQEGDFDRGIDTLWIGEQRPIVCIISGFSDDRPLLCRDRCVQFPLRELLDRMKLSGRPPVLRHIQWPEKGGRDPLSCLKQQVKWVLRAQAATPEMVRKAYNDGITPFVFFTRIRHSEFGKTDAEIPTQWLDFWRNVGSEPLNKPLAVFVIFELELTPDNSFSLTRYFEEQFILASPASTVTLSRLNSFDRDSVIDWLHQTAEELALSDEDIS